jgi:hypothetical protein
MTGTETSVKKLTELSCNVFAWVLSMKQSN